MPKRKRPPLAEAATRPSSLFSDAVMTATRRPGTGANSMSYRMQRALFAVLIALRPAFVLGWFLVMLFIVAWLGH